MVFQNLIESLSGDPTYLYVGDKSIEVHVLISMCSNDKVCVLIDKSMVLPLCEPVLRLLVLLKYI